MAVAQQTRPAVLRDDFDPCAAELFVSISHSFEAGIANAISSFKRMKNKFIYENICQVELSD